MQTKIFILLEIILLAGTMLFVYITLGPALHWVLPIIAMPIGEFMQKKKHFINMLWWTFMLSFIVPAGAIMYMNRLWMTGILLTIFCIACVRKIMKEYKMYLKGYQ